MILALYISSCPSSSLNHQRAFLLLWIWALRTSPPSPQHAHCLCWDGTVLTGTEVQWLCRGSPLSSLMERTQAAKRRKKKKAQCLCHIALRWQQMAPQTPFFCSTTTWKKTLWFYLPRVSFRKHLTCTIFTSRDIHEIKTNSFSGQEDIKTHVLSSETSGPSIHENVPVKERSEVILSCNMLMVHLTLASQWKCYMFALVKLQVVSSSWVPQQWGQPIRTLALWVCGGGSQLPLTWLWCVCLSSWSNTNISS